MWSRANERNLRNSRILRREKHDPWAISITLEIWFLLIYNKYIHIPGQTNHWTNGLKLFEETHWKPGGNMGNLGVTWAKLKKKTLFPPPPYCLHNSSGNAGNFSQYLDKFLVSFDNI